MLVSLWVGLQKVTLYGSSMLEGGVPTGQPLELEGVTQPGVVTKSGLVLYGTDGKAVSAEETRSKSISSATQPCVLAPQVLVKNLQFEDGKMIPASKYFSSGESCSVELNEEELKIAADIKAGWL